MIRGGEMDSGCFSGDRPASRANLFPLGNLDLILQGKKMVMNMDESSGRRFSTISGHLFDHECYDHHRVHERKHRLTSEQVNLLEKSFQEENKLEPQRKSQLAKKLGLPPRQVAVWFQNRRARSKIKQIEQEYDLLKCLYDSLREKHELVLEENEKLKSKVLTLTEELQSNGANLELTTNQTVKHDENRCSCAALSSVMEGEDHFSEELMAAEQQPINEPYNWWIWPSMSQPLW